MWVRSTALVWTAIAALLSGCGSDGTRASAPSADIVRVGIAAEPYPPFTSRFAGEWVGFEIDLYRAVCEAEGLRCEAVEVPWDGIIPALLDRRIDVIWSSMTITEERRSVIDFTGMYYNTTHVLIGAASDPARPSIDVPSSLAGKTIGVGERTVSAAFMIKHFGDAAEIRQYATVDDALSDLKNGEIDYLSEGAYAVAWFLKDNPAFATKAVWPMDAAFGLGVGAGVRKEDDALREKLNHGIATIVRTGRYDDILSTYPGLDDEVSKPQF